MRSLAVEAESLSVVEAATEASEEAEEASAEAASEEAVSAVEELRHDGKYFSNMMIEAIIVILLLSLIFIIKLLRRKRQDGDSFNGYSIFDDFYYSNGHGSDKSDDSGNFENGKFEGGGATSRWFDHDTDDNDMDFDD